MVRSQTWLCHLVAIAIVAIWGSTFVFTEMLLLYGLSPARIFTLRFIIAYVLLLGYSLLTTFSCFRLFADTWRDELLMAGLGVSGGTLYFLLGTLLILLGMYLADSRTSHK